MSKSTPTALRVTHSSNVVTVSAGTVGTSGNRKFKNESAFWYALLQTLRLQGHTFWGREPVNLVKKIMSKDGHLMGGDTYPYYLRDRKWRYCIYDPDYDVRDLVEELHRTGSITLRVEYWEMPA